MFEDRIYNSKGNLSTYEDFHGINMDIVSARNFSQEIFNYIEDYDGFAPEEPEWLNITKFALEGVCIGVIAVIGLIGNFIALAVFTRCKMDLKPLFKHILIVLTFFDIITLIGNIFLFSFPNLSSFYQNQIHPYTAPYIFPFAQIGLTGSIYGILAVAIERYMSVCHPHFLLTPRTTAFSICYLILFSIVFNVCRFLEYETTFHTEERPKIADNGKITTVNITFAAVSPTKLRESVLYSNIMLILIIVMTGLVPLTVLCVLNTLIFKEIKRRNERLATMTSRQRRDLTIATALVGVVLVFIICHSFKFAANIYEIITIFGPDQYVRPSQELMANISHFLCTVNSSINFIIYAYKDESFRGFFIGFLCYFCRK